MNRQRLVRIVFAVLIAAMLAAIFFRGAAWLIQGRIDTLARGGRRFVMEGPEARWLGGMLVSMALLPATLALKGRGRVVAAVIGAAFIVSLVAVLLLEFFR